MTENDEKVIYSKGKKNYFMKKQNPIWKSRTQTKPKNFCLRLLNLIIKDTKHIKNWVRL